MKVTKKNKNRLAKFAFIISIFACSSSNISFDKWFEKTTYHNTNIFINAETGHEDTSVTREHITSSDP